jgi:hypothetical protein
MNPIAISLIVLACALGGSLLGIILVFVLPKEHLTADSKDLIKLGTGLIGTMAALILGLLLASTKDSFETTRKELTQLAANVGLLDRVLAHYGPETKESRDWLRRGVERGIEQLWSEETYIHAPSSPPLTGGELVYNKIQDLSPQNEVQRTTKKHALNIALDIGRTRWLIFEQKGSSISTPFLVVLIFWFTVIFASFGLFAPRNATSFVVLFVCALSLSGALLLILELDGPFDGLIQIPSTSFSRTLAPLGE